jgi:hypothetical protein
VLRERAAVRAATAAKPNDDDEMLRRATAIVAAADADPTATPLALRRFTPEEVARRIVEEQHLADATPLGGRFYSELLGMSLLKTNPITDEDVYAIY